MNTFEVTEKTVPILYSKHHASCIMQLSHTVTQFKPFPTNIYIFLNNKRNSEHLYCICTCVMC